ncbi:MAG TPA: PIG-L deacetylase family protein [Terriglobales bacterium]|nr:PIG-L deacetylase family protein [Terriglobales bacterium]
MGKHITRRELLGRSLMVAAALGLPLAGQTDGQTAKRLKVVVAGAHPDDPESGCGGTMALYSDMGHDVSIIYLTRGEAGIRGKSEQEAAAIRTGEAQKACAILKAKPVFAGQIDGDTEVNRMRYEKFARLLQAEQPDIVFTHWPVDTHRDHRAASLLVYDAWLVAHKKFDLYYFEVEQGTQTQLFHPTNYVDITKTAERKRAACFAHMSQQPEDWYRLHEKMNAFRGMEAGYQQAEAFVRHCQNPAGPELL